jgi:predicted HAD superfamily Cof-like phosphohydrolase
MGEFGEVGQFHHKFGLDNVTYNGAGPRELTTDLITFRMKFLCEELQEFLEGVGLSFTSSLYDLVVANTDWNKEKSHPQMFDALIDLVYVAYGTAHVLGYPWKEGWIEVQRANMTKQRAKTDGSDSLRGSSFDVVKPPGWQPPEILHVLREVGFDL